MNPATRTWSEPLRCALIPLVLIPGCEWLGVARYGSEHVLWLNLLLVFPALAAVPALAGAAIGLLFRRTRHYSGRVALCSAVYNAAFILALRIGESVRMAAFHRLAERSKPLVAAVHAFEKKQGRPPESLQALVPEFIASIPSTGMGAYPRYRYEAPATNYAGNPWVITVYTPSGGINFDQFMYFPLTNYPNSGFGGWLERVGDWAYLHE